MAADAISDGRRGLGLGPRIALALVSLSLLSVGVVGAIAYNRLRANAIAGMERAAGFAERIAADRVETRLRGFDTLGRSLSTNQVLRNAVLDNAGRDAYLTPMLESVGEVDGRSVGLFLADARGNTLLGNRRAATPDAALRLRTAKVVDHDRPDALAETVAGDARLTAIYPVASTHTGRAEGALIASIDRDALIADLALPPDVTVVLHLGRPGTKAGDARLLGLALPRTLAGLELFLETRIDDAPLDEDLAALARLFLGLGILVAAIAIAVSLAVARRLSVPLTAIAERAAQVVGAETLTERFPVGGSAEARALAGAFNAMMDRLERSAADERRAREASYRAIFESVLDAIIIIDEKGLIRSVNPATVSVFGYDVEEMLGRNVNMLMPEPYRSSHDGYLSRYLATGDARIIGKGREVTGLRKNGATFPMELSVSEAFTRKERLFTGLVRDISERKRAEIAKAEFISTVSHELRTPMTAIQGALNLVNSGALGEIPTEAKEMTEVAEQSARRLVRLINDILDIERIGAGKLRLVMARLDLAALIERAVQEMADLARRQMVAMRVDDRLPGARVQADPDRLLQVITNLLSNACKFSPEGGKVEIVIARGPRDRARISVIDQGPGIPEAFRSRLFDRFAQADSSDSRAKGGTGLGLAITKELTELMGGEIGFASRAGQGSTFFVDIPLAEAK